MATHMVICTFRNGTDMAEVFTVVDEEQRRVAELVDEGRLGSIHLSLSRGTVFIETFASDESDAETTIRSLPMARWWDLDVFPLAAPVTGTAA
jgi:muconolactone delta-isomerase